MKRGGLKLLERSPCKLTSHYKTDIRRGRERISKLHVMWIQCIFRNDPCSLQTRKGGNRDPTCTGSICSDLRTSLWDPAAPTYSCSRSAPGPLQEDHKFPLCRVGWFLFFFSPPLFLFCQRRSGTRERAKGRAQSSLCSRQQSSRQSRQCSQLRSAGRFCSAAPENPVCTGGCRNNSTAITFSISRDIFTGFTSCASVSAAQRRERGCCSHR